MTPRSWIYCSITSPLNQSSKHHRCCLHLVCPRILSNKLSLSPHSTQSPCFRRTSRIRLCSISCLSCSLRCCSCSLRSRSSCSLRRRCSSLSLWGCSSLVSLSVGAVGVVGGAVSASSLSPRSFSRKDAAVLLSGSSASTLWHAARHCRTICCDLAYLTKGNEAQALLWASLFQ